MAAIYEKALKRKDYSGVMKKDLAQAKEASHDKKKTPTPPASASSSESSTIVPLAGNTFGDNR
jgi:hypothetical protein